MGFSLLSAWQARNKKPPALRVVLILATRHDDATRSRRQHPFENENSVVSVAWKDCPQVSAPTLGGERTSPILKDTDDPYRVTGSTARQRTPLERNLCDRQAWCTGCSGNRKTPLEHRVFLATLSIPCPVCPEVGKVFRPGLLYEGFVSAFPCVRSDSSIACWNGKESGLPSQKEQTAFAYACGVGNGITDSAPGFSGVCVVSLQSRCYLLGNSSRAFSAKRRPKISKSALHSS